MSKSSKSTVRNETVSREPEASNLKLAALHEQGDDPQKVTISEFRKTAVRKINADQKKIDETAGQADSIYLNMGKTIAEFIEDSKAHGETSEDHLYTSLVKDKSCTVRKSALYNARFYWQTTQAMIAQFGKAPKLKMTYYVKIRHDAFTLDEQHDLLLKAEADSKITVSKLNALVADKLKEKGRGRVDPTPTSELTSYLDKAVFFLTKASGLFKEGICPTNDASTALKKTADLIAQCKTELSAKSLGNASPKGIAS
jgi:hypothetical protein